MNNNINYNINYNKLLNKPLLPVGIPNIGNTCYGSAFLQIFFSCNDFIKLIINTTNDDNFIVTYQNLIFQYLNHSINKDTLKNFFSLLGCEIGSLQDSTEYGREFLTRIINNNIGNVLKLFGIDVVEKSQYNNYINENLIREIQLELAIPLDIYNKKKAVTFDDLWNNYFSDRSEKYEKSNIFYTKILANDPKYMLLNIKRSIFDFEKKNLVRIDIDIDNISMEKNFLINKYTVKNNITNSNFVKSSYIRNINGISNNHKKITVKYKLIAFSNQIEEKKSKHWITYRLFENKWFKCDDSTIEDVDDNLIEYYLKKTSLLLYEKVNIKQELKNKQEIKNKQKIKNFKLAKNLQNLNRLKSSLSKENKNKMKELDLSENVINYIK